MGTNTIVVITGSRYMSFSMQLHGRALQARLEEVEATQVMHGACEGADELADQVARLMRIPCTRVPADWKTHGKAAGPIRNRWMAERCQQVLAFPGGDGTTDMVGAAVVRSVRVMFLDDGGVHIPAPHWYRDLTSQQSFPMDRPCS